MTKSIVSLQFLIALFFFTVSPTHAQTGTPTFTTEAREIVAALPEVPGTSSTEQSEINQQPILVTFFASWCPPCFEEFAHLNHLHEEYADTDLKIIAINVYEQWDDEDEARMARFIETTKPAFPALVGSEEIRDLFGGISRIPTVYGFDRNGNLAYRFTHKRGSKTTNASFDELKQAADLLLTDS